MKTLNNLIYEAGGYSAKDLENASNTERRQILQLGSAVLFSIIASIISWGAASTLLVSPDQDLILSILTVFVTVCVVFPLTMSLNRNLIFYSDMKIEEEFTYSYSEANKGSINTLLYLRIILAMIENNTALPSWRIWRRSVLEAFSRSLAE